MSLEPQGAQSFELPAEAATETTSAAILAELQATAAVDAVQVSPFGESIVVEPSPRVQVDAVEGLLATDVETYTDGVSGSAALADAAIAGFSALVGRLRAAPSLRAPL